MPDIRILSPSFTPAVWTNREIRFETADCFTVVFLQHWMIVVKCTQPTILRSQNVPKTFPRNHKKRSHVMFP